MLTHNEDPAPAGVNAALVFKYGSAACKAVADCFAAQARALAKVPDLKSITDPEARKELEGFEWHLEDSVYEWIWGSITYSERHRAIDLLNATKRHAVALHRLLERLHLDFERTPGVHVTSTGILRIDQMIGVLIEGVDMQMSKMDRRKRRTKLQGVKEKVAGRPQGSKKYPGVGQLVRDLEYFALAAGGKGFGIPAKGPVKGRIIQALDQVRNYMQASPELRVLAEFLPPAGQHPVSVYQRAISEARTEVAEETPLEHSTNRLNRMVQSRTFTGASGSYACVGLGTTYRG